VKISISALIDGSVERRSGYIQEVAQALEERGFAAFRQPDHVALFRSVGSRYPYSSSGTAPLRDDQGFLAPLLVLALAGAATTRLRLGTAVEVAALREPIARAKEIASLDVLTDGRLDYGVGVGWMREEYEACGVPFESRGRRTDEFIGACKALWTEEQATFAGEFFAFRDVVAFPKPAQAPHPPLYVGGHSAVALRRAARLGDGWFAWNLAVSELDDRLALLARTLRAAGREPEDFTILVGIPNAGGATDDLADYARELRKRNVDEMVIGLGLSRRRFRTQLDELAGLIEA
jgi:probable F420-dependent oxidoreductase